MQEKRKFDYKQVSFISNKYKNWACSIFLYTPRNQNHTRISFPGREITCCKMKGLWLCINIPIVFKVLNKDTNATSIDIFILYLSSNILCIWHYVSIYLELEFSHWRKDSSKRFACSKKTLHTTSSTSLNRR